MESRPGKGRCEDIRAMRDSKVMLEVNEWDTAGGAEKSFKLGTRGGAETVKKAGCSRRGGVRGGIYCQ